MNTKTILEGENSQSRLTQITWNRWIYILRRRGLETQILGKIEVSQRTAYNVVNKEFLTSGLRLVTNLNFNAFFFSVIRQRNISSKAVPFCSLLILFTFVWMSLQSRLFQIIQRQMQETQVYCQISAEILYLSFG